MAPAGEFTELQVPHAGPVKLAIRFLARPDRRRLAPVHESRSGHDQTGGRYDVLAAMRARSSLIEARFLPRGWYDVLRQVLLFVGALRPVPGRSRVLIAQRATCTSRSATR